MSTILATASPYSRFGIARLSLVERRFLHTLLVTVGCVLFFKVLYLFEVNVLHVYERASRFVGEPSDTAMRYIALPHIIIGFLFLVTSRRNQTLIKRTSIVGLVALGAVLCAAYGAAGGKSNTIFYSGVYVYFLVHELRDQAMFYTVLGDAPTIEDRQAFQNMVRTMIAITVSGVVLLVWAALGVFSAKYSVLDPARSLGFKTVVAIVPLIGWTTVFWFTLRHYGKDFGGVTGLLREHGPLFRLMIGGVGILGLSLLLTHRPYSLILFHVVSWYLFTNYQLAGNPVKAPPAGWWSWMRTSLGGFRFLHNGMVLALMAVGVVWVFQFGKPPALNWLLAEEAFPYWTILHVTVSFLSRPHGQ